MSIVERLASSQGLRTQEANAAVATECVAAPDLLHEIAGSLASKNNRLAGDCAEVMTKVAESRPDLVAPFAQELRGLLGHTNGRVRWEAAHALALVADLVPDLMERELKAFTRIILTDTSVIVRDYLIDAVGAYGARGHAEADRVFSLLRETLLAWGGKHAARGLASLGAIAAAQPLLASDVAELARAFRTHARPSVRAAAKVAVRSAETTRRTA